MAVFIYVELKYNNILIPVLILFSSVWLAHSFFTTAIVVRIPVWVVKFDIANLYNENGLRQ